MATDISDGSQHETSWIYACYDENNGSAYLSNNTSSTWSNSSTSNYGWRIKNSSGSWVTSYCGRCYMQATYNSSANTITLKTYVRVKSPGADSTTWHSQLCYAFYDIDGNRISSSWLWGNQASVSGTHSQNTVYSLNTTDSSIAIPANAVSVKCYPYWWCGTWSGSYGANVGGRIYWSSSSLQFVFGQGCAYIYNGTEWKKATPYIYDGTEWKRAIPYIYNGTEWKMGIP